MEEIFDNLKISLIFMSFILTIISKIIDNSYISIILVNQKVSPIILYFSSILSSLILNTSSIIIGYFIKYFINIDIIKNFFIIIIFTLYGFMSLIILRQSIKKEKDSQLKTNNSSDEDSERPYLHIKTYRNDVEIELDNLNVEDKNEDKIDFNDISSKESINNNIKKSNMSVFYDTFKTIILIEIGEKIQIFIMSLSTKYINLLNIFLGNFLGIIIVNAISINFGLKLLEKKINNISLFLEVILYLTIAIYYIYLSI